MGTFVVLAVLILAVGLVLRSMIRAKKAGKFQTTCSLTF